MKRLIFGCGFLGSPAGQVWSLAGDEVFGITRKRERFEDLEAAGIRPILGDITKSPTITGLPAVDTVLVAVGMDRTVYSDIRAVYVNGLQHILDALPVETGHLIYISSTGVYGSSGGKWVNEQTETNPTREGGQACLEAEKLIKSSRFQDRFTILRFAGLYGGSRIPMKNLIEDRQWEKLSPQGFLNLIHVEDGARIIQAIAQQRPSGETFLVSDGHPASRKEYYETLAEYLGSGPINWPEKNLNEGEEVDRAGRKTRSDKRISNQKLCQMIEFEFRYPDFHAGLRQEFEVSQ